MPQVPPRLAPKPRNPKAMSLSVFGFVLMRAGVTLQNLGSGVWMGEGASSRTRERKAASIIMVCLPCVSEEKYPIGMNQRAKNKLTF